MDPHKGGFKIHDAITVSFRQWVARNHVDAVEGIERGDFPPTPEDVFLCGFCSYGSVCRKDYVGDV